MANIIDSITFEQESLIPVYREKWKKIALSTDRIDRISATETIRILYDILDLPEPEIVFFDSPYTALKAIILREIPGVRLKKQIKKSLKSNLSLRNRIQMQLLDRLVTNTWGKKLYFPQNDDFFGKTIRTKLELISPTSLIFRHLGRDVELFFKQNEKLQSQVWGFAYNIINFQRWVDYGCLFDYCISVLKWEYDRKEWEALQLLIKNCGCLLAYERICFVCDRPTKLFLDSENLLHKEGEAAIEFADGYKLYAYHGVTIPEKYGFFHPSEWQPQWLLQEKNAEIKKVLIQGIGYERICQELKAVELNSWREYTLLTIDNNIDVEPIHLLKMTCPSTRHIHALRVPPTMKTAREAINWVNWGIDPEMFIVET